MGTTPGSGEVRFPGFDVLGQQRTWDDVTRTTVVARLSLGRELRFFNAEQGKTARALLDRLLAQDDEPRVPVLEMIDERLSERRGDGYRYDDMPEDWDAFSASIDGLDVDARATTGRPFWDVGTDVQMGLVDAVRTIEGDWHGMPGSKVFALWTRYACDAFYSHPWAWNEIGFGGPAYPRGYKNLGAARREPWEVPEHDAADPVPWAQRAEKARAAHETAVADRAATGEAR
jgi:gluconate 2-dehydrogenase subunit 3-like protein